MVYCGTEQKFVGGTEDRWVWLVAHSSESREDQKYNLKLLLMESKEQFFCKVLIQPKFTAILQAIFLCQKLAGFLSEAGCEICQRTNLIQW